MLTRWGRALDRDHPLPEYPRPQLVRDAWVNLNGVWEHAFTDAPERPASYDGPIVVPFSPEAELSGVGRQLQPDEWLWYRRSFTAPSTTGRVLLHFGAVDQSCTVWVNGAEVGSHTGGYLPFTLDVTDHLAGDDDVLEVRVRDLSETGVHARGKQRLDAKEIWYTAQSGIWQTVWLEAVPASYVERLVLTPHLETGELEVTVVAAGDPVSTPAHVVVGEDEADVPAGVPVRIPLSDVRPWSPDAPPPVRRRGDPRRRPGHVVRRPPLVRHRPGRARPHSLPAQRRTGDARRRARPGVLARRAAHPAERRGDGPRHRDDEVARLHHAAQAREDRAAALVRPLRPPRHARLAGRRQRRWPLPRPHHPASGAVPGLDPRPPAPALRPGRRRRPRGVPARGATRRSTCSATWCPWRCGRPSTRPGDSSTPTASRAGSPTSTRPGRSTTPAAGSTRAAATSAAFHRYLRPFRMPSPRRLGRRDRRAVALSEYGGFSLRVEGHDWSAREFGYRHFEDSAALADGFAELHEPLADAVRRRTGRDRLHPAQRCRGRAQRTAHLRPRGAQDRRRRDPEA